MKAINWKLREKIGKEMILVALKKLLWSMLMKWMKVELWKIAIIKRNLFVWAFKI